MTIPSDYADRIGVDVSKIYHVNAGRKRFTAAEASKLLDLAFDDPRLAGLTILHLRPDLKPTGPHFCRICPHQPKNRKKAAKRKARHGQ